VPSFCRHNRLETSCPICSRKLRQREQEAAQARRPPRAQRPAAAARSTGTRRRPAASTGMRVRRLARAGDDGFHSELVPGLHASADARRLAQELVFAAARLEELGGASPPGLYGRARELGGEEGLWLAFLIAYLGPLEDADDPFAEIARVHVAWAGGTVPGLDGTQVGPRGAWEPARHEDTLLAYRAWAERSASQAAGLAGDASWTPERRFERAFERLALPGLTRAARYDFLLSAGALGLAPLHPSSLHLLADPRDPTVGAAKRVFGIGDVLLVQRRAGELAAATDLPIAALDLGLLNWARLTDDPEAQRITCGSRAAPDPDAVGLVAAELGLEDEPGDAAQPAA
jgi:hypothetical protein